MQNAPTNLVSGFAGTNITKINLPLATDATVDLTGKSGRISGFGKFNDTAQSNILRHAKVNIISNSDCEKTFGIYISGGNICISTANNTGACSGDSGSPLTTQIITAGKEVQVGITSFGSGAGCTKGYPVAYTRVTNFLAWINSKIGSSP